MCVNLAPRPGLAMEDGANNPHDRTGQEDIMTSDDGIKSSQKSDKPVEVGNTKKIIDEGGGGNNEKDIVGNGENPLHSAMVADSSILLVLTSACFKGTFVASLDGGGLAGSNGDR